MISRLSKLVSCLFLLVVNVLSRVPIIHPNGICLTGNIVRRFSLVIILMCCENDHPSLILFLGTASFQQDAALVPLL